MRAITGEWSGAGAACEVGDQKRISKGSAAGDLVPAARKTSSELPQPGGGRRRRLRRLRSRSSPVRCCGTSSAGDAARARSPSASASHHGPPEIHPILPTHYDIPQPVATDYRSQWSFGAAYFSGRPPAKPLRLVALAASPVSARTPQPASPPPARVGHKSPSPKRATRVSPPPTAEVDCTYLTAGGAVPLTDYGPRRRDMKRLLRELVAALPLPADTCTAPDTRRRRAAAAGAQMGVCKSHDTRGTLAGPTRNKRVATCSAPSQQNVAVQALATNLPSSVACDERKFRSWSPNAVEGAEWVGGVRALRDSHVRLVLRQLRHIERLNRALDRAAPARSSRSILR